MLTYNDIYELLRKEKYSEPIQQLPKDFINDFSNYIKENSYDYSSLDMSDSSLKSKKQLENSLSLFKELMLRRKKKILNLIFVANETGIMKRDYENMLDAERQAFDKMVKAFEESDKELSRLLNNKKEKIENKRVVFKQEVDQFINYDGSYIGPYKQGELVNMDYQIAYLFVNDGKAAFVDENWFNQPLS